MNDIMKELMANNLYKALSLKTGETLIGEVRINGVIPRMYYSSDREIPSEKHMISSTLIDLQTLCRYSGMRLDQFFQEGKAKPEDLYNKSNLIFNGDILKFEYLNAKPGEIRLFFYLVIQGSLDDYLDYCGPHLLRLGTYTEIMDTDDHGRIINNLYVKYQISLESFLEEFLGDSSKQIEVSVYDNIFLSRRSEYEKLYQEI